MWAFEIFICKNKSVHLCRSEFTYMQVSIFRTMKFLHYTCFQCLFTSSVLFISINNLFIFQNFLDVWKFTHKIHISYISLRKLICCFLSCLLKKLITLQVIILRFYHLHAFSIFSEGSESTKSRRTWKIKPQNMATMSACKWETISCYFATCTYL